MDKYKNCLTYQWLADTGTHKGTGVIVISSTTAELTNWKSLLCQL